MVMSPREKLAEALTRVAAGSVDWQPWADLAMYAVACERERLTTDNVWAKLIEHNVPSPREPRAMGVAARRAVKRGWWIITKSFEETDEPVTDRHPGRPQRVYVSAVYGRPAPGWPSFYPDAAGSVEPPPGVVRGQTAAFEMTPPEPMPLLYCPAKSEAGNVCGRVLSNVQPGIDRRWYFGKCPTHRTQSVKM